MTAHIPFKYDFVGSFLRPEAVQNAKALFKKGLISKEELTKVENTEIEKLIAKQKAAGYHVITDGEYRRAYWHLDFFWGLNGIEQTELSHGYFFNNEETAKGSIKIVGKISGENHPLLSTLSLLISSLMKTMLQSRPSPLLLSCSLNFSERTILKTPKSSTLTLMN